MLMWSNTYQALPTLNVLQVAKSWRVARNEARVWLITQTYIQNILAGFIDEEADNNPSEDLLTEPAEVGHQEGTLRDCKEDQDDH